MHTLGTGSKAAVLAGINQNLELLQYFDKRQGRLER